VNLVNRPPLLTFIVRLESAMPEFVFFDKNPKVRIPFTCEGADPATVTVALEKACGLIPRFDRRELLRYWREKLGGLPHFAIENVPFYEEQMIHMSP
jgi:hypothetical protein